jgi:hypothetical protein
MIGPDLHISTPSLPRSVHVGANIVFRASLRKRIVMHLGDDCAAEERQELHNRSLELFQLVLETAAYLKSSASGPK